MEASLHRLCMDDDTIARFTELVPSNFTFMQAGFAKEGPLTEE